ncbi:hypothetical protein [Streptomyces sp. NPDC090026]|uniref:hypothetical protein n=1 Tax=Streptomyces sp. NPDC090026 TaxID=3365923 RepID=UPI0038011E5C
MTPNDVAGLLLGLAFTALVALAAGLVATYPRPARPDERPEEFAAGYLATFEPMQAAVDQAVRETTPGAPSPDLGTCWSLWPDAPLAHDIDGGARDGR